MGRGNAFAKSLTSFKKKNHKVVYDLKDNDVDIILLTIQEAEVLKLQLMQV